MANRNIKITYTKESGRPPLYTTEMNRTEQEKFFSAIIKEIVLVDDKGNQIIDDRIKMVGINEGPKVLEFTKTAIKPVITLAMVKEFLSNAYGKTEEAIEEFLNPTTKVKKTTKKTDKSLKFQ